MGFTFYIMSNRIKFLRTEHGEPAVHFTCPINDYTLCGLTLDGDDKTLGDYEPTNDKVDCEHCITIVKLCKSIKQTEHV